RSLPRKPTRSLARPLLDQIGDGFQSPQRNVRLSRRDLQRVDRVSDERAKPVPQQNSVRRLDFRKIMPGMLTLTFKSSLGVCELSALLLDFLLDGREALA